jgi:hypothetical protein
MSLLVYKNIYFLPSFHNHLQFSIEVRKLFAKITPDIVAVELPDIYYSEVIQAVNKLPKLTMLCLDHGQDTYEYIPIFPSDSMIEGIRLAKENSLPIAFIDLALKDYKVIEEFTPPDTYAINSIGIEKYYALNIQAIPEIKNLDDSKREEHLAFHLDRLSKNYKKVLFIGGMFHWENIKKHLEKETFKFQQHETDFIKAPFLAKLGKKSFYSLLEEIPYVVFMYEIARRFNLPFDKWNSLIALIQETKTNPLFEEENYTTREVSNLIEYAKKLAFIDDNIIPDLYNLLLSAKQTLGDDYAFELMELALSYNYENNEALPIIDYNEKENSFFLSEKKITLKRKLPNYGLKGNDNWQQLKIVKKKKEDLPKDYFSEWFMFGFYSHLPEDVVLEGFIDRVENKVKNELMYSNKILEFSGSLLDGIELRETIRNFTSKKIYVKEIKKEKVSIGAWLIVFDDDLSYEKYPWAMSLASEHHNESDIAFYASNPLLNNVTRNIVKAEYGALLAFKPALPEEKKLMWEDIDVADEHRIYQMLMLAIDLNPNNGIIYIASKPPDQYYYKIAEQRNKKIYYLPISRFSNRNIRRLKRFHLLKNKATRRIADDYI